VLSGYGYSPPTDNLIPGSLTFPDTAVGGQPSTLSVLLTNLGDLPLKRIVAWTGAAPNSPGSCLPVTTSGEFSISSNTCDGQLAAHAPCYIYVQFEPATIGNRSGTLTVYDALGTQTVPLAGTGVANAKLVVSPTLLTFPVQNLNTASPAQTLTLANNGGIAAAGVGYGIVPATGSGFTVTSNCPQVLNKSASCTLRVVFSPTQAGQTTATLSISSTTQGAVPVGTGIVTLSGSGQATSGLNVSPSQLTFAETVLGSSSAAQTVTVSNSSTIAASQLTVVPTAPFSLTQNTCPATLAANSSCTVGVVFSPTSVGPVTGALQGSLSSIVNTASLALSGTGAVAAAIQVSPASLTFSAVGVGQTSSPALLTVTNSGTASPLANLVLAVPQGFQLVSNVCPTELARGLSCTTSVEFVPPRLGPSRAASR
jgi:hypothetical protein